MEGWRTERLTVRDGVRLAVHIRGEGRPVFMLHGFLANARINWITPGVTAALIEAGFQVLAPDLRGHGRSDARTAPEFWPVDVLADDGLELIRMMALTDYDLVGYSLGARTAARMLVRGAKPRGVVLGGMGASGIMEAGARAAMFEDAIRNGEAAADPRAGKVIQAMIREGGLNRDAMLGVLASFAPTCTEELRTIAAPTLVISGDRDEDNGSPEELAALVQNGRAIRVPGHHNSAPGAPEFAAAIVDFLKA